MSVIKVKALGNFTVLLNSVLEDPSLSFKAKGLWAYCMSRPNDWEFHVSHLATVSKEGTDAVYSALKELTKAGLVQKVQDNSGGKFGRVDYLIFPYPQENEELKKCLPLRDFPLPENPRPENPALLKKDLYKERSKEKKYSLVTDESETRKEPPISKEQKKREMPPEASEMAQKLLNEILGVHPGFKRPNLEKWAEEIERLHRLDGKQWEDILKVIDFAFHKDKFWKTTLQSAEKLRKHFDAICMKMGASTDTNKSQNMLTTREAQSQIRKQGSAMAKEMYLSETHLVRLDKGERIPLSLEPREFEDQMIKLFNLLRGE